MPGNRESLGDAAQIRMIVEQVVEAALASAPDALGRNFVTRDEMERAMEKLETRLEVRLENTMLKMRNWVMGGIIATAMIFGGGFLAMLSQFNRTADAVGGISTALESRAQWIGEQDNRDRAQDESLRELDENYHGVPYEVRPK